MKDVKHIGTPEWKRKQRWENLKENVAAGALAILFTAIFYVVSVIALGWY